LALIAQATALPTIFAQKRAKMRKNRARQKEILFTRLILKQVAIFLLENFVAAQLLFYAFGEIAKKMTRVNRKGHFPPQVNISPKSDAKPIKVSQIAVEEFDKMKTAEKSELILEERTFRVIPALSNIALFAAAVLVTKWMIEY
jgi:hypothetical protein